jgi:acyl-coenzyme A thioesterase PaaI-like protein
MRAADDNGPLERRSSEGTMSAEVTVPEGFVPYTEPGPFLDRVGPLYERDDDRGLVFGFCVLAHHCNRRGFAHGGLLVTLADVTLGKAAERRSDPPVSLLTTSITYDFIGVARRGQWIEAQADFKRVGREIAFANCYIRSGGRKIGRASGVFKVAPKA